ncbi:hypothetical protein ACFSR7_33260 [Cohnella sp. GCM10020058]|uniref:hypothetical protein n=1 Tax=Cohnella sp. GCM10020058 TaxID=3317330 RepID=UPI00363D3D1D
MRAVDVPELFGSLASRNNCVCTCIFYELATLDEIPANLQVNSKIKPEIQLMRDNNCILAATLFKRERFGEIRCIFAGIAAREDGSAGDRPAHPDEHGMRSADGLVVALQHLAFYWRSQVKLGVEALFLDVRDEDNDDRAVPCRDSPIRNGKPYIYCLAGGHGTLVPPKPKVAAETPQKRACLSPCG